MIIRNIDYVVTESNISPVTVQDGGVQGDNCSVAVNFDISALEIAENDVIRIDISTGDGNFFSSEHLSVTDSKVKYILPIEVSKSGGIARLHLIVTTFENGVEKAVKYSYPAKIRFSKSSFGSTGYNEYQEGLSGLAKKCEEYADKAVKSAENLQNHNTDITAHPYILNEIQSEATAREKGLNAHNIDSNAHSALFGSLRTAVSGITGGMEKQAESINELKSAQSGFANAFIGNISGVNCIRIDNISPISHKIKLLISGNTDESGNVLTNPTVHIYGKNIATLTGWTNKAQPGAIGKVIAGLKYTFSFVATQSDSSVAKVGFNLKDSSWATIANTSTSADYGKVKVTFTATKNGNVIFNGYNNITASDVMLEVGSAATEFEAYAAPTDITVTGEFATGQTATAEFDSKAPTMTVIVNGSATVEPSAITAQYHIDSNAIIKAIVALGGIL